MYHLLSSHFTTTSITILTIMIQLIHSAPADSKAGQNGLSPVTYALPSVPALDTATQIISKMDQDTSNYKMNSHYRKWLYALDACNLLYHTVSSEGIVAQPGEINARDTIYARAFPGVTINNFKVKQEIILEKYLTQKIDIVPSPVQLQACYNEYVKESPLASPPGLNDISPILNTFALFSSDTVVQICDELRKQNKENMQERYYKSMETWPLNIIRIDADSQSCLAINPVGNECIVSVGEFNKYLVLNPVKRKLPLEIARSGALKDLLTEYYVSGKAIHTGVSNLQELIGEQEKWIEKNYLRKIHPPAPIDDTIDNEILMTTYDKYYNRFFGDRKTMMAGFIGSTDSIYIDSLYRVMRKIESDSSPGRAAKKRAFIDTIPWTVSSSEKLPASILASIDTLKNQQICKTTTPFGFFLCRLLSRKYHGKIHFKEAYNKLRYLVAEEQVRSGGKSDSVRAIEYYQLHKSQFVTPDTLVCRTWLIPSGGTFNDTSEKENQHRRTAFDTTAYQSLVVASYDLPDDVERELVLSIKEKRNGNDIIGPIHSRFGTWYFSVTKKIVGGNSIPFLTVKDEISEKLEIQSFPFDSIIGTEAGARLVDRKVLKGAYMKNVQKQVETLSEKEIEKLIADKTIKIQYKDNRKIDDRLIRMARHQLADKTMKKELAEVAQWIGTINIDKNILSIGCREAEAFSSTGR